MIILAVYTHQNVLNIALESSDRIIHLENICINENTLSYFLPKVIKRILLKQQKIDCITFHNGPGGFTSLRITSALLQSIAFAKKAKIYTPSHFEILKEALNIANGRITIDHKGENLPSVLIKNDTMGSIDFFKQSSEEVRSSIININIHDNNVIETMLAMAKKNKNKWQESFDLTINYGMLPNYKTTNNNTEKNIV